MVQALIGVASDGASVISGAGHVTTEMFAVVKALFGITSEAASVISGAKLLTSEKAGEV